MSLTHPLAPLVAPSCAKYPQQGAALFQAFVDLSLAQQWRDVQVIDLEECNCAVVRGRPKLPKKAPPAVVYPMGLTTPTSLEALSAVLAAVSRRFPSSSSPSPAVADSSAPAPSPAPTQAATPVQDANAPMIYLAVVEKDASIVYYVLRDGIVSPKEVPE